MYIHVLKKEIWFVQNFIHGPRSIAQSSQPTYFPDLAAGKSYFPHNAADSRSFTQIAMDRAGPFSFFCVLFLFKLYVPFSFFPLSFIFLFLSFFCFFTFFINYFFYKMFRISFFVQNFEECSEFQIFIPILKMFASS